MKIQFRIATQADLPTLLEFEQGIILAERPFDETLKSGHISYYDLGALIDADDAEVFVALDGEFIVSSAYIKIKEAKPYHRHDRYGYLGFMYVRPEYRGRGINKLMVDALIKWARSQNLVELRLDVYNENDSAVRAYQKAGFEKDMVNMRMGIGK